MFECGLGLIITNLYVAILKCYEAFCYEREETSTA